MALGRVDKGSKRPGKKGFHAVNVVKEKYLKKTQCENFSKRLYQKCWQKLYKNKFNGKCRRKFKGNCKRKFQRRLGRNVERKL